MRDAILFFLFMCFHLTCGTTYAHASAPSTGYTSTRTIEKTQQVIATTADQDLILAKCGSLVEENTSLPTVDDNEDDEEDSLQKHISLVKYILAFSYAFVFDYHYNCHADNLAFYTPPSLLGSYKYIEQRVLRI